MSENAKTRRVLTGEGAKRFYRHGVLKRGLRTLAACARDREEGAALLKALGSRIDAIASELESSIDEPRRERLVCDLQACGLLVDTLALRSAAERREASK
jgi:hypothetical protein